VRLYGVRLILYETPMMGRLIPHGGVLKSAFYTEAVVLGGMAAAKGGSPKRSLRLVSPAASGMAALQGGHAKGVMF
jgi:hypothetical protein